MPYCISKTLFIISWPFLIFVQNQMPPKDDVGETIKQLYIMDPDRANPKDIVVNYQQYSNSPRKVDPSKEKFFKFVNKSLINAPVYKKFSVLFDNYELNTGRREVENAQETKEIDDFLAYVYNSTVFKKTFDFLKMRRQENATNIQNFRNFFRQLWFGYYSRRSGILDTSGFEHVFVGEISKSQNATTAEIGGLHNWFRFYHLEQSGAADYSGFVVRRRNLFAMIQFEWQNVWKPSGSFIIGSSPVFDLCAYTICFLMKPGFKSCQFDLDGCMVSVTSHKLVQNRRTFVGSAYPSPGPACR
uniref:Endoribonuclease n=1 Tax=Romanomermis culicivorax TaxID=13658 RepID=A0A915HEW0_ROMCU